MVGVHAQTDVLIRAFDSTLKYQIAVWFNFIVDKTGQHTTFVIANDSFSSE
jgi:hypothetical protein